MSSAKKKLPMISNIEQMIKEFQCAGCIHGYDPSKCAKYMQVCGNMSDVWCGNHHASTFMSGVGRIALGLPKGFNRYGAGEISNPQSASGNMMIRFYVDKPPTWNEFNVPVWKMVQNDVLFVRTFSPRVNASYVDVINNGKLDLPGLEHAIDVGKFYDEID